MTTFMNTFVAAMIVTAAVAQAADVVSTTKADVTAMRQIQLTVLFKTQEDLAQRMHNARLQAQALSTAKVEQGAYEINIAESNDTKNTAWYFMVGGLVGSYGLKGMPLSFEQFVKRMTKPTWVMAGAGGAVWIGGWVFKSYNQIKLRTSESKYVEAVETLKIINEQLKNDRDVVLAQATTLGVKVENKILSFDGLNLPEGLKVLGGSSLNLNN